MYDIGFYGEKFLLRSKDIKGVRRLEIIRCIEEQYMGGCRGTGSRK